MEDFSVRVFEDEGFIVEGPEVILDKMSNIIKGNRRLNENSKYHIDDKVRITDNVMDIYKELYGDGSVYNHYDAWDLAKVLAGKVVTVEGMSYLRNYKGFVDLYYTVSRDSGLFYVLPGYCLSSV